MGLREVQENLFNDILELEYDIPNFAKFVQNDLEKMLKDGDITKEQILRTIPEVNNYVIELRDRITKLGERCTRLMINVIDWRIE